MHYLVKVIDYIFLLRPTLLLPVWAFFLIGAHTSKISNLYDLKPVFRLDTPVIGGLFAYSMLMGAVYVMNQIYDIETDRRNKKLFLLSEGYIGLNSAWIFTAVLIILSYITLKVMFPNYTNINWIWALSLALGIMYNVPPLKFKGKPILDLISNAVGYGALNVMFGIAAVGYSGPISKMVNLVLPYIFAVGSVFLLTTIPDIPGDREANEFTTGVVFGPKLTALFALILMIFAFLTSTLLRNPIIFYPSLISIPLYFKAFLRTDSPTVKLAYRLSAAVFALVLSIKIPLYLLLGLLTFIALKLYYRWRFQLNYPSLVD